MTRNPHRTPDGRARRALRRGLELDADTRRALADYLDAGRRRGLRPLSIQKQSDVLRIFAEHVHPRPLVTITPPEVETFLDRRQLSARTRYHYLSTLHSFFEWAIIHGEAPEDPTLRVPRPRYPRSLPRPIPDADLEHALAIATPRDRAVVALAAFHGLRAAEIAGLQREDILEQNDPPVIVVTSGKGGHQRVMPLHPQAWEAHIRPWAAVRRHGWLFLYEDGPRAGTGQPVAPWVVSAWINTLLHEAGIVSTLHSLRHYYGTKVYGASRDLRLTQALMGHASPITTTGYVAWSAIDAREAVEALHVPR